MRTEFEIRREVESRLRRRGLLVVNGGLWLMAVFILSQIMPYSSFGTTLNGLLVLFMLGWTAALGLHTPWTIYVELREWLVRRAIDREREFYRMRDTYEKRKHSEALSHLTDDGELIDFPEALSQRKGQE
jgi:hypothetical protein